MLLREFIYFDKDHAEPYSDDRYLPDFDQTILDMDDLRKTPKLTLRAINDIRKAGEAREKEVKENLGLIRKMYATPEPEQAPM
jgi:hypothetical protein